MNKYAALAPSILDIIKNKYTEKPFSGKYCEKKYDGSYLCRGCGVVLFRADNQFHSSCGWPSFDDEISDSIKKIPDSDGRRTEIICAECNAHLGHIFVGEKFTAKNRRYCVNSLAIEFITDPAILKTEEAIVAGGCFWGVQYLFQQLPGVLLTEVGYTDGITQNPTYQQVCSHKTNHVEAMRVIFDTEKISYENIIKYFFEIHDPTQNDGQGPDRGSQYLSRIFYFNDTQKRIAEKLKKELVSHGFSVTTAIKPVVTFWPAEEDHQNYYRKTQREPYCHRRIKRFN
ncbi:MAG: peptide-methionine (S)-S-oxide reductase [Gammaproteobacteria bacterium RIFCSPLOWO2_02_FULL_42_14]|nr:MAG: peptide-methionine (S)-S-oxide reductase [Gammaproteobacteria bacterium RIFCSPHIGHO2_02_FULL_42_43]OGT28921.1 MAG: peptide-methionine (S)-S-oxide reductase [Gammaproteobacteria bacterium RIFCSPHIGHO2_01_FULL_42_8]OGT53627.1 MAG: peptide-methionine (S)-S-oxide reductase [Gammaproteobacteria bacterium RIFCSPHIGHO2_12_FULL_41_25]OGT61678.1 MAG: peptide-methionine (S)-S-oxide reductase [Gammaproteobacteria bacterium RIFCSPLOWO2_02_FULL_42_14]OGT85437.1 MAG: peptide-methionine (S)-S-oxide re